MPRATGTQTRTFNYTTGTTVGTLLLSATNPENGTVTYTYNTDKTLATKTDAGKWKNFTMDVFGNLTSVREPDPLNQPSGTLTTTYAYDILNHLTTVSMPRATGTQTRTFNYTTGTTVGTLLLSATNPENGTVTYTYNTDKTLATKTDAMNQQFSYTYDSYKRVTQINLGQSVIRQFYYDTNPLDGSFSQNIVGRLTAVQNATTANGDTFIEMYSYTQPGEVTKKRQRLSRSVQSHTITGDLDASYSYDNEGKMTSVTYPQSSYIDPNTLQVQQSPVTTYTYGFDTMGRPTSMTGPGADIWGNPATVNIVNNVQYGPASEMLQMSYFGSTETRQYNTRLQMTHLTIPGQLNISYNFAGQNNSQISSQTDNLSGEQITYQYDALKRLYSASTSAWSQTFTYDGFGNLTDKVGTGGAPANHSPVNAATNQLIGYSYDANGNLTTTGYGWDSENRMSYSTWGGTQYAYDSKNKRIWTGNYTCPGGFCGPGYGWQFQSETVFFYGIDGKRLASYTPQVKYSYGTPQSIYYLLAEERAYFKRKYIGITNTSLMSGGNGIAQDRLGSNGKYFPYGEDRNNPQLANDTMKFATYTRDSATGLDYADQRYYATGSGRFLTPDPAKGANPKDPGGWNKYAYTQGDPVNFNDPGGLARCLVVSVFTTHSDPDDAMNEVSTAEVWCISVGGTEWSHFTVSPYNGNWQQLVKDLESSVGTELDRMELQRVAAIAMKAFSDHYPTCGALFHGHRDPATVLNDLVNGSFAGSSLTFADLGGLIGGSVDAAQTVGILGHQTINGINTSVFTGATITINSNGQAPWVAGYPDRFGIGFPTTTSTQDIYRAITLIHELGHFYNTVTGMGGSDIVEDGAGTAPGLSQENTQRVFDSCFSAVRFGG